MNTAAPEGAPPQRIGYSSKKRTAPPCLGEALRRDLSYRARFLWFSCELNQFMTFSPKPDFQHEDEMKKKVFLFFTF